MKNLINKIVVVGCGSIGLRHASNLVSLGKTDVLAFDISEQNLEKVHEKLNLKTTKSFEDVLEFKTDLAFVTLPTSLHLEIALKLAENGIHLFIEKPVSNTMQDCDKLISLIEEKQLVTMVGCNMRFHPCLEFIKNYLDSGKLGKIYSVRAEFGQYLPFWRPNIDYRTNYSAKREMGGGIVLDDIHEIDLLEWFCGKFKNVKAFSTKLSSLEIETEDVSKAIIEFESGVLGELSMDYLQKSYSRNVKITGENGNLEWHFNENIVWHSDENGRKELFCVKNFDFNNVYLQELKYFFDCVDSDTKPMNDVKDSYETLKWALKIRDGEKK